MAACIRDGVFSAKQKYTERGPQKKRPRPASGGRDRDTLTLRVVAANTQNRGNEAEMGKSERERERRAAGSCRLTPFVTCRRKERKEVDTAFLFFPIGMKIKISLTLNAFFFCHHEFRIQFDISPTFMIQIYINGYSLNHRDERTNFSSNSRRRIISHIWD